MNQLELFAQKFSAFLSPHSSNVQSFPFWKGRVALFAILKALGVKEGDEVIIPAFTCVVVPNAIIYLGAKPVYVDICPKTYNSTLETIRPAVTVKTKVILAQNTFGLSADIDPIKEFATQKNIFVIEDCAHGLGGFYKGKANGLCSDASFFSFQWNKTMSTGLGGIAVTSNPKIAGYIQKQYENAEDIGIKTNIGLFSLVVARIILLRPWTYWLLMRLYRLLSYYGIVSGSSQKEELESPKCPEHFLKKMGSVQAFFGVKSLEKLLGNLSHRVETAEKYKAILQKLGIPTLFEPEFAKHAFLRYPLLVKNRTEFLKIAKNANVEIGDWFLSPIHPIESNWELWGYRKGSAPIAESIASSIVNLPTHDGVNSQEIEKIERFLIKNCSYLDLK